jgi:hypothetical protein
MVTKLFTKFWLPFTIGSFACLYILTGKPHINVAGNNLSFDLPAFHHCEISFLNPVNIKSYGVNILGSTNAAENTTTPISSEPINRDEAVLQIDNLCQIQSTNDLIQNYHVYVYIGASLSSDIASVKIDDNEPINLKSFYKNNLKSHGEYIRFRYMRKDLANLISFLNDSVSNWVLTLLFAGVSVLFTRLISMEYKTYCPDETFKAYLKIFLKIENAAGKKQYAEAYDKYIDHWAMWDTRFQFYQALGPALGFILTVSSLIAALDSAKLEANDFAGFMAGISVAMISTFLGLLLRLVALESARVNNKLLRRAEIELSPPSKSSK